MSRYKEKKMTTFFIIYFISFTLICLLILFNNDISVIGIIISFTIAWIPVLNTIALLVLLFDWIKYTFFK